MVSWALGKQSTTCAITVSNTVVSLTAVTGRGGSYGKVFLDAVTSAVNAKQPLEESINLFRHPAYKSAHPTPEHLLPLVVSAAAVDAGDKLHTIYVTDNGALGWGMWMWEPQAETAAA